MAIQAAASPAPRKLRLRDLLEDRRAALTRVLREVGDGERLEDVDALLA